MVHFNFQTSRMFHGQPLKARFSAFMVLLLLVRCPEGLSRVITPSHPIVASPGGDIILPCHLVPAADAVSMTVEWTRPDLEPRFVHLWRSGQELLSDQNVAFKGRTFLFIDKLKQGDLSLKLSEVKFSDEGTYRCFMPMLNTDSTVQLVVRSVPSPVIAEINLQSSRVMLQCESKDWYQEPEVFWLDSEGNLLSAEPTQTVRGPDGLYTVSSRVIVEKRRSNNFTCRVQNNINQTRETHIDISDDCLVIVSSFAARVIIVSAACFICTLTFLFVFRKLHQTAR
ncbi:butyrophilin-like protein 2 [Scomber japonicus]|uniref:butyrophilin-like protein 2 n=1 Tax=Scomber japonicus TaxID=13676 RepID=UPI002306C031|nr:butyrophilin-like protein 2 [Scomber japonicus]